MEGREQTGRVNHALAERINQYILEQKSSIAAISKEIGYRQGSAPERAGHRRYHHHLRGRDGHGGPAGKVPGGL